MLLMPSNAGIVYIGADWGGLHGAFQLWGQDWWIPVIVIAQSEIYPACPFCSGFDVLSMVLLDKHTFVATCRCDNDAYVVKPVRDDLLQYILTHI